MDLENKKAEDVETEITDSRVVGTEDNELTSEYLKKTTKIGNCTWLSLFLLMLICGGIYSGVYPILSFNLNTYSDSYIMAMTDISSGLLLMILAICAFKAFLDRKSNAIFLSTSYLVYCIATDLLFVLSGYNGDMSARVLMSLIVCSIWLVYLHKAEEVETIIPVEFRNVEKRDYILVGAAVVIPMVFFIAGMFDANRVQSNRLEKRIERYNELHHNFYDDVKDKLTEDQRSDGKMIFTIPEGFSCRDTVIQEQKYFYMENKALENITLTCRFDNDASPEHISAIFYSWEPKDLESGKSEYVSDTIISEYAQTKRETVKKYKLNNGSTIYWRFLMLFDHKTTKACLISSYDRGNDEYLKPLINSILFKPE